MKSKMIGLALVLAVAVPLLTYNLVNWPVIWFDEGLHLQVSKNLVQSGLYGLQSSEAFRLFDPLVTIGFPIAAPITAAFACWGIGLLQARLVIVVYAILTIICFFVLTEGLFDVRTAVAASLLFIATPATTVEISATMIGLGRMVMGEVPALLFVLAGTLLWFNSLATKRIRSLAGAGLLYGLAIITKQQSFLVLAALLLVWLADRLWYGQLRWYQVVVPVAESLICAVLWYGYQAVALPSDSLVPTSFVERIFVQASAGVASPRLIVKGLGVLLNSGALTWGGPGLIYGVFQSAQRNLPGLRRLFLMSIALVWLFWFMIGSIGWLRYAFPALAVMNIFTAKLLADLSDGFAVSTLFRRPTYSTNWNPGVARNLAITLAFALMVLIPILSRAKDIAAARDTTPWEFARYLDEHVPQETIIESFEPELAFLSSHVFHQPSLAVLNMTVRHVQLGLPYPPGFYDPDQYKPGYLVNGNWGKRTGLYASKLQDGSYNLVTSIGNYDLYRVAESANR